MTPSRRGEGSPFTRRKDSRREGFGGGGIVPSPFFQSEEEKMKCLNCENEGVFSLCCECHRITVKEKDEVDALRSKLDIGNRLCKKAQEHIGEVHERNARLTAELASLREKAGVKACSGCKALVDKPVPVHFIIETTGEKVNANLCGRCVDRALDALRGK